MAYYGTNPDGNYFKLTASATAPTFFDATDHAANEGALYFNSGTGTITAGLWVYVAGTTDAFVQITENIDAAAMTTGQLAEDRGGVPIGGVITFAGAVAQAPTGYVLCDGCSISGTGAYAALYTAIGNYWGGTDASTMKVPDFRGYFLRGVTADSTRDPNTGTRTPQGTGTVSVVGSYQDEAYLAHTHTGIPNDAGGIYGSGTARQAASYYSGTSATGSTGGSETRPKNMYVNFYIKYIST